MSLTLKNPHSVLAVIARRPRAVLSVTLASERPSGPWREIVNWARGARVAVSIRKANRSGPAARAKSGREGGCEARVAEPPAIDVGELFGDVAGERSDLWIALDQVQDPHNVGAIFRTAAFFGIRGILLTRDRSAPISSVVCDTASGGVESVPFARPANLRRALDSAKQAGLWVLGSSTTAGTDVFEIPRDRPRLLVLGNEEKGMRSLTAASCDEVCHLSGRDDGVSSLNVSVAAGVLIGALCRTDRESRGAKKGTDRM